MSVFRSHVASLQKRDRLSVQQTAPLKLVVLQSPKVPLEVLGYSQFHGQENHGLKFAASKPPREMLWPQSWQAWPSRSPPCRTSSSCQPWLLPSCEFWSCTVLEEWTCQTSSPHLCRSQPTCSGPWKRPTSWAQLHWPTHQEELPLTLPSDPSWLSLQPSLPSSPLLGPWFQKGRGKKRQHKQFHKQLEPNPNCHHRRSGDESRWCHCKLEPGELQATRHSIKSINKLSAFWSFWSRDVIDSTTFICTKKLLPKSSKATTWVPGTQELACCGWPLRHVTASTSSRNLLLCLTAFGATKSYFQILTWEGGTKASPEPESFVSAEKCRGSVCHDRSYHPKRPLTIPYEWTETQTICSTFGRLLLALQPFAPPLPQYYFSSPCKLSCSEPQRTLLSVELRSSSIFLHFHHVFNDFPSFTFAFFKHFSCRSSTFLRFPPP